MKVTVIFSDSTVYVDGKARQVVLPPYDPNMHAIQWDGEHGTVEVLVGEGSTFCDFGLLDPFLKVWEKAAPPAPAPLGQPSTHVEEM
jgi:hypothetical protein